MRYYQKKNVSTQHALTPGLRWSPLPPVLCSTHSFISATSSIQHHLLHHHPIQNDKLSLCTLQIPLCLFFSCITLITF